MHPLTLLALEFDWSREMMFLVCAAVGGTVISLQTVLLLFGFGGVDDLDSLGDGDVELEGTESAFGFLSMRAVAAFLCFFGLAGWGATSAGWGIFSTIIVALVSGFAIMFVVAWILSMQRRLYSEGNLYPERIVGQTAKVYLRIPPTGKGKVTVAIQGRSQQYEASSPADFDQSIPTGAEVRLVRLISPGSFEVKPV